MLTTHRLRETVTKLATAGVAAPRAWVIRQINVQDPGPSAVPDGLASAAWNCARALVGAVVALQAVVMLFPSYIQYGACYLFLMQDEVWLLLAALFLAVLSWRQPTALGAAVARPLLAQPAKTALGLVLLVFVATFVGTYVVHMDYPLVRDELMAVFDARIYETGRLIAPMPPEWREFLPALMPRFVLPVLGDAGWVSTYLPGNSAFRALMGIVLVPQIANPLLAAVAVSATWVLARQLWPDRIDAALIAVLLMATSTQMLFMAMTTFAMTGHMALTLVWLLLFLRNDRVGHAGAIATGFVATGWHQLIFHPLFAMPFVLHLWWVRRYRAALFYTVSYALMGLFWMSYWTWFSAATGYELGGTTKSGLVLFVQRALELIDNIGINGFALMGLNLGRFVAWQNPLLVPLLLVAALGWRKTPMPLRLASLGLALTLVVALLLLPFQGHGWGYRYVHGYIGILCLIAAGGWVQSLPAERALRPAAWATITASCAFVILVLLPFQSVQVHEFLAPHARPSAAIARATADVVVVDERTIFYGEELVRNDPFLRTKPVMLNLEQLEPRLIAKLCQRGHTVSLFDHSVAATLGALMEEVPPKDWPDGRKAQLAALPCLTPFATR